MKSYYVEKSDLKGFYKVICKYEKDNQTLIYTYTELPTEEEAQKLATKLNK